MAGCVLFTRFVPRSLNSLSSARASSLLFAVPTFRFFASLKKRHRGTVYVPRQVARVTLAKAARKRADPTLLLTPYVNAYELRILFHLDFPGLFRLLGVRKENQKYFWKDHDGRQFETTTKRRVMVPFSMAAIVAQGLGFKARMLDNEPDWRLGDMVRTPFVPVVAVLGHINHGKTTLLDSLCGTSVAGDEPGGITQDVRAITARFTKDIDGPMLSLDLLSSGAPPMGTSEDEGFTFMDTPGHHAFELSRGRTVASADAALVLVSVERGAEIQTEEVLLHAARWKVPVIFALNKIDLPDAHVEFTRAELRRQCQRLHENGAIDVDWTAEAEAAVPISALHGHGLQSLLGRLRQVVIQSKPLEPQTLTPGVGRSWKEWNRRTDFLVGVEVPPSAVALVVEVERAGDTGESYLTLLVKEGRLVEGQYFVVGTAMGRITNLMQSVGSGKSTWTCHSASVGMAVQVTGIRKNLGGDCAADDLFFVVSKERAWRLSEHRRRVEALSSLQIAGPPIEVPWEHDGSLRTQAAFERDRADHPEQHANSAYERRWVQPAVEDVTGNLPVFSEATRRDFANKFRTESSDEEPIVQETQKPVTRGRRSARVRDTSSQPEVETLSDETSGRRSRRFKVVPESGSDADPKPPSVTGWGAWSAPVESKKDFTYYTERRSLNEEAEADSSRVRQRWQWRDEARWAADAYKEQLRREERERARKMREDVFETEETNEVGERRESNTEEPEEVAAPLPSTNTPVIPIILKTRNSSQFDVLMDELEQIQEAYGVRVVVVHGGLGPVIARDVTHAEIEKQYGFCPIYAFQVGVHPVASAQAERERINVQTFKVFTDLLDEVVSRCERVRSKARAATYAKSLRLRPTASGL